MQYAVKAHACDAKTGKIISQPRTEIIDTRTNLLFEECKSILDVHDTYEQFWNHINDHQGKLVFVISVKKL